jgi:hypothetical protein
MAHVDNQGNPSYRGSQYTAPCKVDEETMAVLQELQPPGQSSTPLSLQYLKTMFNAIRRKLHLDFNLYLNAGLTTAMEKVSKLFSIKVEQSSDISLTRHQIISYHATRLQWYSTGSLEKLWITDPQVNEVLAAVWPGRQTDKSPTNGR